MISPWKIFVRSVLACSLAGCAIFGLSLKRIEPLPLSGAPLRFEASRAQDWMNRLSKGFPNRVTWSDERKKAAIWLKDEFRKLGYVPQGMQFSENIEGHHYTDLENIYAEKRGKKHPDEIIVVMAHYDITDTTVEGAMDDGSGVGVVLELARIFSQEEPDRTILFLITDSEEFGAFWGARAFAQNFPRARQIVAAASFDFITPEKQTKIITLCDGLKTGYTPLWLRELALDSIRSIGTVEAVDMTNFMEFAERAIQIPPSDHGAMLAAGIPAFNWVGQTDNFAHIMAHYHHTRFDVSEALQTESFDTYGRAAERLVRSIDGLNEIPADFRNSSYWKITSRYYIEGGIAILLHILAFIPFLAYSVTKFGSVLKRTPRSKVLAIFSNEIKGMAILFGSMLLGYAVMLLLPAMHLIPQYETFPATQKSAILYNPDFLAMFGVIGTVALAYFVMKKVFAHPTDSQDSFEVRHAFHAVFLALMILIGFPKNSYLVVLLLVPPAYFWTMIRNRRRREDRLPNLLLLLGGSITFVVFSIVLSTIFHVGVVYWYIFLAATYGLISAYSVVMFFMALTVMIRLLRSVIH